VGQANSLEYLVAPAALVGTVFGMVLLDLDLANSLAWTALTLLLLAAGFPGKNVITDLWSKIQMRFKWRIPKYRNCSSPGSAL